MGCSTVTAVLRLPPILAACAALAVAPGCSDGDAAGAGSVRVVATTGQAADFARQVGGGRVAVTGLLPPNADPHDYEVRPDDVKALADADLVIRSGGEVDEWLGDAIDASGTDAPELVLADHVDVRDGDPHWWQDPRNAIKATAAVEAELAKADPAGAAAYERAARAYTTRLERLDREVARCIGEIPPAQRTLVTTHDSLGAYAARYGLRIVGAVIPSRSTLAQPSAGEVDELIATIRRERVRAIFAESSVNPDVEQAIADAAGVTIGTALYADALGPEGSGGADYVGSIAANTAAIVDGLTGGARSCRPRP
jgi:zinc/manganese transport system substrate-binding protein/manganese/iron transport system substrate-binding protein